MKILRFITLAFLLILLTELSRGQDFRVLHQITGSIKNNVYLIYDTVSKQAAIIDPGGEIDTLISCINDYGLDVRYILLTHGHSDHIYGVPELRKMYPDAKLCLNKLDYDDMFTLNDWILKTYGEKWVEEARKNPVSAKFLDFDYSSIGVPDIFAEDGQSINLGQLVIKMIHCPGHSPGSICYYTGNTLFSGDVLLYRTAGSTVSQNASREELIKSVRRLYDIFHDSTIVYPGHKQFTDIGAEKKENKKITADSVYLKK